MERISVDGETSPQLIPNLDEAGEVYGNGKEKVVPNLEHAKSDGRTNEILAK